MNEITVGTWQGFCRVINTDALNGLSCLSDGTVNCCVTSPPYWGLRDYGEDGQIGLEATPDAYVERLVGVFREVRRVLRDDGTLWLNIGDCYTRQPNRGGSGPNGKHASIPAYGDARRLMSESKGSSEVRVSAPGLKDKDLVGIPWLLAFALRADGWYLRQEIIWHKPNAMPESVNDRCTKSHEHIFLLSKNARYYYDAAAIKEESSANPVSVARRNRTDNGNVGTSALWGSEFGQSGKGTNATYRTEETRNKRSVWSIPTRPYKEAHFAVFPESLVEPCVLAGSPVGGLVLDPFGGSGTTGLVAHQLRRRSVLIELSATYTDLIKKRFEQ